MSDGAEPMHMGSRMCDYCGRDVPSSELCDCEGQKNAPVAQIEKMINKLSDAKAQTVTLPATEIHTLEELRIYFVTALMMIDPCANIRELTDDEMDTLILSVVPEELISDAPRT